MLVLAVVSVAFLAVLGHGQTSTSQHEVNTTIEDPA